MYPLPCTVNASQKAFKAVLPFLKHNGFIMFFIYFIKQVNISIAYLQIITFFFLNAQLPTKRVLIVHLLFQ